MGDQAEFIFSVAMKIFREADMHRTGITLFYKYEEGCDVDYPTYLYFYEKLAKFVNENPEWRQGQFEKSAVYEVKTAIKHKNELKEKVGWLARIIALFVEFTYVCLLYDLSRN